MKIAGAILTTLLATNYYSQTFSNTTVAGCNSWNSGNTYTGFTRNITVSGLPSTLGTGAGEVVLKQVNLQLGNSSCKGNLSSYYARLVSPSGTIIQLFGPYTTTSTSQWMDIKLRDHASLERIYDYATSVKQSYWPFDIGYYRTDAANAFTAVNGEDPNGSWVLQIAEGTFSEVSFERVELIFGDPFTINDISGGNANNDCSGIQCIDGEQIIIGTNNGYSQSDPNSPGFTVDGCNWNGANNNSAWFEFTASNTASYLTLSGLMNSSGSGSADMQPIIVRRSGADCSSGTFTVPTGGCPDDETTNNSSYLSSNGGGISTSGNVYFNGITANTEFNLSGLTIGETYYLYIDGNGGVASEFYIEIASGAASCGSLPVELLDFSGEREDNNSNVLRWSTASEVNNDFFSLERSYDGINFHSITNINGAGNSNIKLDYLFYDQQYDVGQSITYYRLKQVDYNGFSTYSNTIAIKGGVVDEVKISILYELQKISISSSLDIHCNLLDISGRLIYSDKINNKKLIDVSQLSGGIYVLHISSKDKSWSQKIALN